MWLPLLATCRSAPPSLPLRPFSLCQSLTPPWAHLDLKTPNILLKSVTATDPVCALVSDFGTSAAIDEPLTVRVVDNPTWAAPEVLRGLPYTEKVDTYGVGLLMWELVARKTPFSDIQWIGELHDRVAAGGRPMIPYGCPQEYASLIEACWHQEPSYRPPLFRVSNEIAALVPQATSLDDALAIPDGEPLPAEPAPPEEMQPIAAAEVRPPRFISSCSYLLFRLHLVMSILWSRGLPPRTRPMTSLPR